VEEALAAANGDEDGIWKGGRREALGWERGVSETLGGADRCFDGAESR
jgi:hypothetical protein